jgi:hypothetical protein
MLGIEMLGNQVQRGGDGRNAPMYMSEAGHLVTDWSPGSGDWRRVRLLVRVGLLASVSASSRPALAELGRGTLAACRGKAQG